MDKGKNNKGFSLVEMIIVMAMMVILFVGAGTILLNWRSWNVNDCIEKIDTALGTTKIECMSKEDSSLRIWKESDEYFLQVGSGEKKRIGDDEIEISYSDGTDTKIIEGSTDLKLTYDRKDGSYKEIASGVYCTQITVKRQDKTRYIKLVRKTGKHSVQN